MDEVAGDPVQLVKSPCLGDDGFEKGLRHLGGWTTDVNQVTKVAVLSGFGTAGIGRSGQQFVGGHRTIEQIALDRVASERTKGIPLILRLHSFSHQTELEGFRHPAQGRDDGAAVRIGVYALDEFLVDLKDVDVEAQQLR